MSVVLKWKKQKLYFESLTWEGTDTQCSRQLSFTLAANPYRSSIDKPKIALGDVVTFYVDNKQVFVGIITTREKTAEVGTWSYVAMDFMHYLLKSTGTYKFKKRTAEYIAKKLCNDMKIQTTNLARTKYSIPKLICEDEPIYDIIVKAYRKAKGHTGRKYMPLMKGRKLSVITKGLSSGVVLSQDSNVTDATYSDSLDNMINRVRIFSEKGKQLGKVESKTSIKKYGIFQSTYTKEEKVNAKKIAKAMLTGVTKEASVSAIGNIKAISGYSITIKDKATGLTGKFYITEDCHTFENGAYTMELTLVWKNEME